VLYGERLKLEVPLSEHGTYETDGAADVAAIPLDLVNRVPTGLGLQEIARTRRIGRSSIRYAEALEQGTDIYFLGFPLDFGAGEKTLNPLIRSGVLAWIDEDRRSFLLDAISWPGNSGSPVWTKVEPEKPGPYLIGMVSGHRAVKTQVSLTPAETSHVNLNYGLAICVPMDRIMTVVDRAERLNRN
jgi:V8-like Glu-specific endopeptidase